MLHKIRVYWIIRRKKLLQNDLQGQCQQIITLCEMILMLNNVNRQLIKFMRELWM